MHCVVHGGGNGVMREQWMHAMPLGPHRGLRITTPGFAEPARTPSLYVVDHLVAASGCVADQMHMIGSDIQGQQSPFAVIEYAVGRSPNDSPALGIDQELR